VHPPEAEQWIREFRRRGRYSDFNKTPHAHGDDALSGGRVDTPVPANGAFF